MVALDAALFDLFPVQANDDDDSSGARELHGWPDRKTLIRSSPQCLTKDHVHSP